MVSTKLKYCSHQIFVVIIILFFPSFPLLFAYISALLHYCEPPSYTFCWLFYRGLVTLKAVRPNNLASLACLILNAGSVKLVGEW